MTQYDFNRNVLEILGEVCCRLEADPSVRVKFSDLVTRVDNITRVQAMEARRDAFGFTLAEEHAPLPDEDALPPDHNPPVTGAAKVDDSPVEGGIIGSGNPHPANQQSKDSK